MSTLAEVTKSMSKAKNIEARLFEVIDYTPDTPTPIDLGLNPKMEVDDPRVQMIYTNDGRFLGYTGTSYTSLQPKTFLDTVYETVRESKLEIDYGSIGYSEYAGGRKIAFSVPFDPIIYTNRKGNEENIIPSAKFWTGFAGAMTTKVELYTHRLWCDNGARITTEHGNLKFRHTDNGNAAAILHIKELLTMMDAAHKHGEFLKSLDQVEVSEKRIRTFAQKLAGIRTKKDLAEAKTRKLRTIEQIIEAVHIEEEYAGMSAFTLLQGATRFTNHMHPKAGEDYVNAGAGVGFNDRALALVSEMV